MTASLLMSILTGRMGVVRHVHRDGDTMEGDCQLLDSTARRGGMSRMQGCGLLSSDPTNVRQRPRSRQMNILSILEG